MSSKAAPAFIGKGSPESDLSSAELRSILEQALLHVAPGERVLAIIPDKTRDDNTDVLFPFAAEILAARQVAQFDGLVAQGTHVPMTDAEKRLKIGGSSLPGLGDIYDHQWNVPEELVTIGELSGARVTELTEGLLTGAVSINLNRRLGPGVYDTIIIFSSTVPHEVAGFAGGAKYLFPGVAGPDLTHATHWLGALASIENVIGRVETPPRHMIEAAADFVAAHIITLHSVVTRDESNRLRTHVSYAGKRDADGHVIPRYRITMASALDEETCRRVHLGFMDHRTFRREDYENDEDTFVVEGAGRDLYLV